MAVKGPKIRIRLKAYDHQSIQQAVNVIKNLAERTGSKIVGPIALPTKRSRFSVIRSPHKDKDSREQFEIRVHKRLLDLVNPNPRTIDALQRIELPPGVGVELKLVD